jgi:hypothetical protein
MDMKQLRLLFFLLFASCAAFSQVQDVNGFGFSYNMLETKKVFNLPSRCDTNLEAKYRAVLKAGSFFWDSCANHRWIFYSNRWHVDSSGGSGGVGPGTFSVRQLVSSNFSTSTNCPLPALNGDSLQIFWNDVGRFLVEGAEWTNLAGGGFSISVPGFDATANSYSFTLYSNTGPGTPGPALFTSSNFTTATNCPIPAYNGMQLAVFWNDANRYLVQGIEWNPLSGGGFTILLPGFDATTTNYSFYIFNN